MTKNEYRQAAQNLVYLSTCVINEKIPNKEQVSKMNLQQLYHVAKHHMMTAITAYALESVGVHDEAFVQAKAKAMRKDALLTIEKDAVTAHLEAAGIWYMPLRGSFLKELYPAEWMRQMTDVDILFDANYREKVKEIMENLGFTTTIFGKGGHHDCYQKPPVCDFEMHHSLFEPMSFEYVSRQSSDIVEYYKKVQKKLLPDNKSRYGRMLSNEDFYLYMIAHEYKHYAVVGAGVRSLLDTYIYWRKFGNLLDLNYLAKELQTLGITKFEQENRDLAFTLFEGEVLTTEQQEMFEYMLLSGAQGTYKNVLKNQLDRFGGGRKAKLKYCFNRIFPPMAYIKLSYPFVYKHKILIPFLPIYRFGKGVVLYREQLKNEIVKLARVKK